MHWLNIHIPPVADEVGKAAMRSGVARNQAIGAALWVFSRLTLSERAAVIREYLDERVPVPIDSEVDRVGQAASV